LIHFLKHNGFTAQHNKGLLKKSEMN